MAPHDLHLKSRTGRLVLAPASEENDESNAMMRCHPTTRKYLRFLPEHVSIDETRKLREERRENPQILEFHAYRIDGKTQVFAGGTMIFNIDELQKSCEVGIILMPNVHGGGIATDVFYTLLTYVFEERKFHRVTLCTGVDNAPMRGWLEKVAGARQESHLVEAWKDSDQGYSDAVGYAILEREWHAGVKGRLEKKLGM